MAKGKRYSISIDDSSRLARLFTLKLSAWHIAVIAIAVFVVAIGIGIVLIMMTPLHNMLPGYLREEERDLTVSTLLRLDTLQTANAVNEAYIANILTILDTSRNASVVSERAGNFRPQKLMAAGKREKDFVNNIRSRDRYNLSVLATPERERPKLGQISTACVIASESTDSLTAEIILAKDAYVASVADGTVIDVSRMANRTNCYMITIQHGHGLVSIIRKTSIPLVAKGDKVSAGQPLGNPADGQGIQLNLWHNGNPLAPSAYLGNYLPE